jgi:putative transposase
MPRLRRLILPNVAAHIIQRGNNRAACFRETSDYVVYLMHLRELAAKLQCAVHAYCLMTNHVHLLVTPPSVAACVALMRDLGPRYVQYFNRHHGRTGTLWEGRYHSSLIESPRYVLATYQYIERNPVRAGMVAAAQAYRWSSHVANIATKPDPFIEPHPDFVALGSGAEYARLFEDDLDAGMLDCIREAIAGGYPLCSGSFKQTVEAEAPRRVERSRGGRPPKNGKKKTGL